MNRNIIFKDKKIFIKEKENNKLKEWDPFRSKIAAGIKKGIDLDIKENQKILYLGAAEGYTISFISEIIDKGEVYGIDISPYSMQKLLLLSKKKENLIPILGDCNRPEEYQDLLKAKFDCIVQDIAQKNQAEIVIKNSDLFLKEKGIIILSLKLSAISQKNYRKTTEDQLTLLRKKFNILNQKRLDPFEKNHVLIVAQKK